MRVCTGAWQFHCDNTLWPLVFILVSAMASRSKNGHESSQSSDSTSPVAASTASWLFHRMISTEFSKGEDEWEMQLRKSRRKKRRESKSDVSSKDNDDRPGEEVRTCCYML